MSEPVPTANCSADFFFSRLSGPLRTIFAAEDTGWDELILQPGTFIDSQFRQHESDLLFSAPFHGRQCFVYILFDSF